LPLATINGRSAKAMSKSDLQQAEQELRGQADIDPETAILESAPESERWAPTQKRNANNEKQI
jgi:hypothetical protein